MFEYIRRGITRRKRQSAIIIVGMALAVMAVLVISSASAGIVAAQHKALSSVYGVGTDITVTKTASSTNRGGGNFQFGPGGSSDSSGSTKVSTTQVSVSQGTGTLKTSVLAKVKASSGVSAATGTLALSQTKFSGSIQQNQSSDSSSSSAAAPSAAPGQGGGGFGGGNFNLKQTSILGIQPGVTSVGPTADFTVKSGRLLKSGDTTKAVVSSTYAKQKKLSTGSTITLGEDTKVTVVGVLSSASSQSASDVYIPLATAQKLADKTGAVTTIYVKASDADNVTSVASSLSKQLSGTTVSTQSELASTISGSLASASGWITGFGRWLTVGILALAFLLAALFTISSIARRTRELGTLKAIGWSNVRVLGNVAAETLIQTVAGGILGIVLGCAVVFGVNAAKISLNSSSAPSFSSSQQRSGNNAPGGQGGAQGGGSGSMPSAPAGGASRMGGTSASIAGTKTTLALSPSASGIGLGLGVSVLGGLVAAGAGSIKVSRLRPADAMRSVD